MHRRSPRGLNSKIILLQKPLALKRFERILFPTRMKLNWFHPLNLIFSHRKMCNWSTLNSYVPWMIFIPEKNAVSLEKLLKTFSVTVDNYFQNDSVCSIFRATENRVAGTEDGHYTRTGFITSLVGRLSASEHKILYIQSVISLDIHTIFG